MSFLSLLHMMRAKCLFLFLSHVPTNNIRSWKQSQCEMSVTYSCRGVAYSSSTEETKASVRILCYLSQCVCEILSALMCACQAASPSIWITLMKGEKGNNQRSQYFTLDTDACWSAAGRQERSQLSSDLTLGFNATFLSPAHSSRFLSHSLGAPPHLPLSTQPARLTAAKG